MDPLRVTPTRIAALVGAMILFMFGASPLIARASSPPPFIHASSMRGELVRDWNRLTAGSPDPQTIHRQGTKILQQAYGYRRFNSEFPRGFRLDLSRPDTRKVAINFLKGNANNWHGYSRELKVLNYIHSGRRFNIIEAGSRTRFRGRITEFDALLEHKRTKLRAVIEVKDRQIKSAKDMANAKDQITRIAARAKRDGVSTVAWVNRQTLPRNTEAELARHANRLGVSVYHNVTTGARTAGVGRSRSLEGVMRAESMKLNRMARTPPMAPRPVAMTNAPVARSITTRLAGPLIASAAIGVTIYQYHRGGMNRRASITALSSGVGALAGSFAGAKGGAAAGAMIGSFFPIIGTAAGATVGGLVGGIGGALGGGMLASKIADTQTLNFIAKLDEEGQRALIQALREKYAQTQ